MVEKGPSSPDSEPVPNRFLEVCKQGVELIAIGLPVEVAMIWVCKSIFQALGLYVDIPMIALLSAPGVFKITKSIRSKIL